MGIVRFLRKRKAARQWTDHDHEMLEFYSQFTGSGDLVFDVGANVGNRVKIFLKLGAKVVAIEPQDECIDVLNKFFGGNKSLTIVQGVLGSSVGEAELMVSSASTLSTVSKEWVESVKTSGRFSEYSWDNKKLVPMTTLDQLIDRHGVPAFIKVDVEGFEHEVVAGLSRPVKNMSLEFTPECIDSTLKCIGHLESIGDVYFNYSIGESMELSLSEFVPSGEIIKILTGFVGDVSIFGDVYCKFV